MKIKLSLFLLIFFILSKVSLSQNNIQNRISSTNCVESFTVGYTYDFNTNTLDNCWRAYEFREDVPYAGFVLSNLDRTGGTGNSALLYDNTYDTKEVLLVSPLFSDLSKDKKIEFYINNYPGNATLRVGTMSDPDDGDTFKMLDFIKGEVPNGTWEKRAVFLENYNETDLYIAFQVMRSTIVSEENSPNIAVYIDDFSYSQSVICSKPDELIVNNVLDSSVELNWSKTGTEIEWEIEYEQIGKPQTKKTIISRSENITINNLLEGTEYKAKVRAKCDVDGLYSDWSEEINFYSACTSQTAGYFESFETFDNKLSPCWNTVINANNSEDIRIAKEYRSGFTGTFVGSFDYEIKAKTGNQFVYFHNFSDSRTGQPSDIYLVSRKISDINNLKRLKFNLISNSRIDYNKSSIHVGTMSDPNDISTFNLIETIAPDQMNELIANGRPQVEWKEHTIYFNNYTGSDSYIAIRHGDEFGGSQFFIDDFLYEEIPDCSEPLYPKVIEEKYNTVDITWETYEESRPSSWEIQYGVSGFTLGNGITITSNNSQTTINNLQSEVKYDFYVRANCGTSFSNWSTKQSFTTKCEGVEVGYFESFENQNEGFLKSCWTSLWPTGTGSSYWDDSISRPLVVDNVAPIPYTPNSGSNCVKIFNEVSHPYGNEASDQIVLVSPRLIDFNNYKKISFWLYVKASAYASPNEIIIGTLSDPDDYKTFTPYHIITNASERENEWVKIEIEFSDYNLTDEYIGIKQAASNRRQLLLIDDFEYTEKGCVIPTNLQAFQSDEGKATLSWKDNNRNQVPESWEIEYGEKGFNIGTGNRVIASTNPFVLEGLNTFTDYEFYVRANCNSVNENSNWSKPYLFRITCVKTAPFNENFDQYNSNDLSSLCWIPSESGVSGIFNTDLSYFRPSSKPNVAYLNHHPSSGKLAGIITSPFLADLDNDKVIKFWLRNDYEGNNNNLSGIVIGTMSNPKDRKTFTPFVKIKADEIPVFGKEFLIDFSTYTGTDKHIAIMHDQNNNLSYIHLDDFSYNNKPDCLEPINFRNKSISDNSITLSWESDNSSFEIEYGLEGFQLGTGIKVNTNNKEYKISGLNPDTKYEFYIRTKCDSVSYSERVTTKILSTSCMVYDIPWEENFNTMSNYGQGVFPNCMTGDSTWVSSNTNLSDYQVGDEDTHYLHVTYDDHGVKASLKTPMLDLEAGTTYNLSFKIRKEAGDYSFQSVDIRTGMSNRDEDLDIFLNYFSDFNFGFYDYHTINTTFTPVVSGQYTFGLYFNFSSPVHTISVDSFKMDSAYDLAIKLDNNEEVVYDFESEEIPKSIILEHTENSISELYLKEGNRMIKMSGGAEADSWFKTDDEDMSWEKNQNNISKANFEIDATDLESLFMNFDILQKHINTSKESIFRVVVNGNIIENFYSNNDKEMIQKEIDLSAYVGNKIRVSLQYLGRNRGDVAEVEDSIFIDNLRFRKVSTLGDNDFNLTGVEIYPNPVFDELNIKGNSILELIKIYDLKGRLLKSYENSTRNMKVTMNNLSKGIYLIEIHSNLSKEIRKIVKK
ncbi:fibronectin type III domain-containing protein [Tenacibaculum sp. ZS6-P6]|uniref:fibronectin type III domain-containing protein n=1 Tax=Tenacibaculum sp. ZS6-P6 TaxID=3447503 RepID=UPI003F9A4E6E